MVSLQWFPYTGFPIMDWTTINQDEPWSTVKNPMELQPGFTIVNSQIPMVPWFPMVSPSHGPVMIHLKAMTSAAGHLPRPALWIAPVVSARGFGGAGDGDIIR